MATGLQDHRSWDFAKYFASARVKARSSFSGGERDHLFLSEHGHQFVDLGGLSGLDHPGDGRAVAIWDYDRDGWPDLAVASSNQPWLQLYRNQLPDWSAAARRQMLAVRLVGGNRQPGPNREFGVRDGYGAQLRIQVGSRRLLREHRCGEGLASQNSAVILVGLDEVSLADRLEVRWPSGRTAAIEAVPAGTLVTAFENPADSPDGTAWSQEPYGPASTASPEAPTALARLEVATAHDPGAQSPRLKLFTTTATWCPACKRSIPQLRRLREQFAASELEMFGVPIDPEDQPPALRDYAARYRPGYQMLSELTADERTAVQNLVGSATGSEGLPSSVITDATGRVLRTQAGVPSVSDIRLLLGSLDSPATGSADRLRPEIPRSSGGK